MTSHLRLSLLTIALTVPNIATAQERVLYFGAYGGSYETILKQDVIPAFEKANNIRISYVSGNSTETLAKLQAQKGNQQLDAVLMDDGPMYQTVDLGFCDKIVPGPNYANVYDIAKIGDKAVGIGFIVTGIAYNEKIFSQNSWPAPTKWVDLADPKFKKRLAMPPANGSTYGINTLVMYAKINGGSEDNIGPGFEYIANKIAPNMLAFEPSTGRMSELLQTGEVVAAVWGNGRTLALANAGAPIKFVYPQEGAPVILSAACTIAGSKVSKEAQAFVDYLLSPEIQQKVASGMGLGPVNKLTKLTPEVAAQVPYGPEQVSKLSAADWKKINPQRDAWNRRWTREIER